MAKAIYYPPANRTAQWFGDDYEGALIQPNKGLWHTTETGGWPAYGGGASAPQLTYDPRKRQWRQHFPLNRSGRALRNDGTRRTNREHVVQVEIVCSSDRSFATKHGYPHVTELSSGALDDLAEFEAFMHEEWGVALVNAPSLPYPQSYGNTPVRMTWSEYVAFRGWMGHLNAPGNTHGDPGSLPAPEITARAKRLVAPAPTSPEDDMTEAQIIAAVQRAINASSIREMLRQQVDAATADINNQLTALTEEVRALRTQLGS